MACSEIDNARLSTAGGIKYKLIEGPRFTANRERITARESLLIDSANADAFYLEVLPPPQLFAFDGYLWSIRPARRRLPGSAILYTSSIDISPYDRSIAQFNDADAAAADGTYADLIRVDVSYETDAAGRTATNEIETPAALQTLWDELTSDVSNEILKVPEHDTQWLFGGNVRPNTDVNVPAAITIPLIEWTITRFNVLSPHFANISNGVGKINDDAVAWLPTVPLTGQLLFLGLSSETNNLAGSPIYKMQYKFLERRLSIQGAGGAYFPTWNDHYRPSSGEWETLQNAATGNPLIEDYDFDIIFTSTA